VAHREDVLLSRITTTIALIAALVVAVAAPVGYFYLMAANEAGRLRSDANVRSFLISQVVSSDPELWKFKAHTINGIISRRFQTDDEDSLAVVDTNGDVLYKYGPSDFPAPLLTATDRSTIRAGSSPASSCSMRSGISSREPPSSVCFRRLSDLAFSSRCACTRCARSRRRGIARRTIR
jgi:hypothetical protein